MSRRGLPLLNDRRGSRRIVVSVLTLAVLAVTATAAFGSGRGSAKIPTPYKIGNLPDLSGPLAFLGVPEQAGLQAYFKSVNKKGGVHGRKIALISRDVRSDVQSGPTLYRELVSKGALAVVGPDLSQVWAATAPLAAQEKVAQISAGGIDSLVRPPQPYLYLGALHLIDAAKIQVEFLKRKGGVSSPRVAAMSLQSSSTEEWRTEVAKDVPGILGGQLVSNQQVDVTASNVDVQVSAVIRTNPDYVLLRLLPAQIPLAVRGLRDRGFKGPVIDDFVGGDEPVFKATADEKYYALRQFADPADPNVPPMKAVKQAAAAAGVTAQMTSGWFTYGYALGMAITQALKTCGVKCDGPGFDRAFGAITRLNTRGLSGILGFSTADHQLTKFGRVYVWSSKLGHAVPVTSWLGGRGT